MFQTDELGKPILQKVGDDSDHTYQDDNGVKVNQHGYLIDEHGNIVDANKNVMLERYLLSDDGKLPSLFKNKRLFGGGNESDDDLNTLLEQIEQEGHDTGK